MMIQENRTDEDNSAALLNKYRGYFYTLSALALMMALCSLYLFVRLLVSTELGRMTTRKAFFLLLSLTMLSRCVMFALEPWAQAHNQRLFAEIYLFWSTWTASLFIFAFFVLLCAWADFYFLLSSSSQTFVGPLSLSTLAIVVFAGVLVVVNTGVTIADFTWANHNRVRLQALQVGVVMFLTVCLYACSLAFLVFGGLLVRLLAADRAARPKAVKVGAIALAISLAFLFKAVFQTVDISSEKPDPFGSEFDMPLVSVFLFYLIFEIMLTALMLLLMQGIPRVYASQSRVSKYTPLIQDRSKDLSVSATVVRPSSYSTINSTDSDEFEPGSYRLLSGSYDNSVLLEIAIPEHR